MLKKWLHFMSSLVSWQASLSARSGCHQTEMPEQSCVKALDEMVGKIEVDIVFERIAWDDELADIVRRGEITNPSGSDLKIFEEEFYTKSSQLSLY